MSATKRDLLQERWTTMTRDVQRFENESDISGVNSRRWRRIDDTLDEHGGRVPLHRPSVRRP